MTYTETWNEEFIKNTAFLDRNSIISAIEVGSFEGLTSNYITDNLLAHNGKLIAIDPLDSAYELDNRPELFKNQYDRFVENTWDNKNRITLMRDRSDSVLPLLKPNSFQFVYVDGDHSRPSVYNDSVYAFNACAVGGYILWDDYLWNPPSLPVKGAIDQFLSEITNYRLLLKLNQVLIQKLPEGSPTEDGQDRYQELSCEKLFNENTIHAGYCNLDERVDRNDKMIAELNRVGFHMERQRSFPWHELYNAYSDEDKQKVDIMYKRGAGAIGCHYSQVEVMKKALDQGKHAIVTEDDLVFCDDFNDRLKIIYKFLNQHEWDIFWFGGTYHKEPTWHKSIEGHHTHPDLKMCNCLLNRDWEETLNPRIVRTYGAFSTHAYMVNKNRIKTVLDILENNVYRSMGIDWIMILQQPNLFTYAFNPGCIKQYNSQSNITNSFANQDGFRKLGQHWFSRNMNTYIPD